MRTTLAAALFLLSACGSATCDTPPPAPVVADLPECIPCAQSLPDMGEPMGCVPSLCVHTVSGALCCVGTGEGQ